MSGVAGEAAIVAGGVGTIVVGDVALDHVPVLNDLAPPLELPDGAVANPDGSVTLTFEAPVTIEFKAPGGAARTETYSSFLLRRMSGKTFRAMMESKTGGDLALARSSGLSPARLSLITDRMDAGDLMAARETIRELLGRPDGTLPEHAVVTDEAVTLPLLWPVDGGEAPAELVFRKLVGGDLKRIALAEDTLAQTVHVATGLTPKEAKALLDIMDAADCAAVNGVVGFLAGSGRRTGR